MRDYAAFGWHSPCKSANSGHRISYKRHPRGCKVPISIGKRSTVSVAIKPLEDRIVIKQVEAEQTTASGLVIPDSAKEKPQEGEVVAVGPGRVSDNGTRIPVDVNVGDVVIYSKFGGTEVKAGGQDYLVLSSRDILAVIER